MSTIDTFTGPAHVAIDNRRHRTMALHEVAT